MTTLFELQKAAAEKIRARYPQVSSKEFRGDFTLTVQPDDLLDVMRYAKEACGFDMLVCVSSVDHLGQEPRFETNYTLTQAETGANMLVRVPVPESNPSVPSVVDIWRSANWLEREQYDLMGIEFVGHPDLRRIMMWEGYPWNPLRKDFPINGKVTEQAGLAFTEVAPTAGGPFITKPGVMTASEREPRAQG
ncbi:MAG TPA: NADH-quinone oxidoreductase subunit C [Candidatus Akkermansia intestinigallinarum]|uniref:NADH-quinone oxidoreductase subunit C n=1 Tax=Candidatus Akkermansia intestinigallinarum TaxID=2838431 RepID=A0A9D2AHR3_9BACT|nr:NADH-quinone oxidoreductase subunit C [Candidatus Akkermansia intestinigallinarum]